MAFKMPHKNNHNKMERNFEEMTDTHLNKLELEKYIYINKYYKVCKDREMYAKYCTLLNT